MNAKEMFEELGGQLEVGVNGIFYWYVDDGYVRFDKNDNEFYETNISLMNIKLHQAITQQMLELG